MITITDAQRRVALHLAKRATTPRRQPWYLRETLLKAEGVEDPAAELEGLIEALEIHPGPEE